MKRVISTALLALLFVPAATHAAPVCICYHSETHCDVINPYTDAGTDAGCNAYCTYQFGQGSSQFHEDAETFTAENLMLACEAKEADADAAEAATASQGAAEAAALTPSYPTPTLQVDIPGVSFVDPVLSSGVLASNFIGVYVAGVYKFLIGFAFTIAVVMIMVGGLRYVVGASTGEIGKAKEQIQNAAAGFVLLSFVAVILFTTNPGLTLFKNLEILVVPPPPPEYEDDYVSGAVATSFGASMELNVFGAGKTKIPVELVSDVDAVARTMAGKGYGMSIASSFRSVEAQRQLIYKNCQNPPGSNSCNPKPGYPNTCILKDNNAANCPHTTGRALDVWGTRGTTNLAQCVTQDACEADQASCRADPCQAALISAMRAEGFCNLANEPWHFEKPKMSSTCN